MIRTYKRKLILTKSSGIYKITNPANGKVYIGQTNNFYNRYYEHKRKYTVHPLYNAFRKYGFDTFLFEIIEECPVDVLNIREKHWLDFYESYNSKKGYNICQIPGETTRGRKRPKSEMKGISDLNKSKVGELNHFYGKKHTDETRLLISTRNKGKIRSQEFKDNVSRTHKGRISEKRIKVKCTNADGTFMICDSITDASLKTGAKIWKISRILKGDSPNNHPTIKFSNADVNAAKNILSLGKTLSRKREPLGCALALESTNTDMSV